MTKNVKYKGKWHLVSHDVDNSTHKSLEGFEGDFEFDSIYGGLLTLYSSGLMHTQLKESINVFLGDTDQGAVTLYSCLNTGHRIGKRSVYTYSVDYVFEGGHIYDPSKTLFSTLYAELHNLNEWVDQSTIKISRDNQDCVLVKTENLPLLKFDIDDKTVGKFRFYIDGPTQTFFQSSVEMRHHTQFIIEKFHQPASLEQMMELLKIFQYFIMLCLNKPSFPTSITLFTNIDYKKYGQNGIHRVPFKLLLPKPQFLRDERILPLFKMIFGYDNFKENFQNVISTWYRLYYISPSSFDLIFERYYTNYSFTENDFLNLAQALEAYHAKQRSLTKFPIDEYEEMRNLVLSRISKTEFPVYHEFLKSQFAFGNYASLHNRLEDIIKGFSDTALNQIIGDPSDFVKCVKWNRNYYTHYDAKLKRRAKNGADLFHLSQRLQVVFLAMLLVDLGLEKQMVVNRLVDFFKFLAVK